MNHFPLKNLRTSEETLKTATTSYTCVRDLLWRVVLKVCKRGEESGGHENEVCEEQNVGAERLEKESSASCSSLQCCEFDYNRVKDEPSCEDDVMDEDNDAGGGDHKPGVSSTQNDETFMLSRAKKRRLCDPTNVKALQSKEMGLLNAAKQYHVPRTSLTRICSVLKDDTNVTVEDPIHPRLGRTSNEFHMKNSLKFYNILETEYKKNNLSPDGVYTVLSLGFTILHKDSQKVSLLRKECQVGRWRTYEKTQLVGALICANALGSYVLIGAKKPKLEAPSEKECNPTPENLTKLHISDPQVEKLLAQKFIKFSHMGFELTPEVMWKYAYQFAVDKNIPHNFTKRMLKHHWHNKFLNRNPEVGTIIQDRSSRNKKQNQMWSRVVSFYDNLWRIYSRCGLFDAHPELVYNQGEIILPLYHILAEEDRRTLRYQKKASSTVIVCANAAGELIPPLVVLKEHPTSYGDCPSAWPGGTVIVNTEDGLVNEAVIRVWLQHFERHKIPGKVLLTLDGQHSSKTMKIGDICMERDIELLLIPQLEMFALHPLHDTVLKTFKKHYVQKTSEWCYLNPPKTNGFRIPFPEMLTIAWDFTTSNQKQVSRGFVTSGIHPINPDIISQFRQPGGGDPFTTVSSVVTADLNDSSSPGEDSLAKENLVESKTNYFKDAPTISSPASSP
uniref:DDE-1 domain-containing protein n=1 Tax=Timema bartmani TaxID=61472 RepID=A0A7R9F7C2_9NEOP|nr:unnamed protein product [Timema bartmani]